MKCYKYKDYSSAIFLLLAIDNSVPAHALLLGIFLYENNEMERCLFHLKPLLTPTSYFYQALACKKLKKYDKAISLLTLARDGSSSTQADPDDPLLAPFLVDKNDTEYFDAIHGDLYILSGKARAGVEFYRRSFFKNPLLCAAEGLYAENIQIKQISNFADDPIMAYHTDLFTARKHVLEYNNHTRERQLAALLRGNSLSLQGNFLFSCNFDDFVLKYQQSKFLHSYLLAALASELARCGNLEESLSHYNRLRHADKYFINGMDVYSTVLWRLKNESFLGLLAEECITSHPDHHITWAVIGNYYSIKNRHKESYACLERSIRILETPHTYALLGFEANSRRQYSEAQAFFRASLSMLEYNDKALFGLGIMFNETFKPEKAEEYFNKAVSRNQYSLHMETYIIRFNVKNGNYEKAIDLILRLLFPLYHRTKTPDFDAIASFIQNNSGVFKDLEELIFCELAEVMHYYKRKDLALQILNSLECRTSSYFCKKALIESEARTEDDFLREES